MSGGFTNGFSIGFNLYTFYIIEEQLPNIRNNVPYFHQFLSSDPATWSLQAGTLPAGMTLSSDGVLSGTSIATGEYTFTIRAISDATSYIDDWEITIEVALDVVGTRIRRNCVYYYYNNLVGRRI